ncbi:hypothetical protein LTR49_028344 [Elasticomyces elasticus]|nr:hypothetical protein LTR49_028344 [Elasticomyces elasticus]
MESGLQVQETPDYSLPEHHLSTAQKEESREFLPAVRRFSHADRPSNHGTSQDQQQERHRLSPLWLSVLVAAVTAVVVGAAVGGGVGSGLGAANKRADRCCSSSAQTQVQSQTGVTTAISTSTVSIAPAATTTGGLYVDYVPAAPSTVATVHLDFPNIDGKSYTTLRQQTFALSCSNALAGGDYTCIVAYDYTDCIEACSAMNAFIGNSTYCTAIEYAAAMANATSLNQGGNCWLKGLPGITSSASGNNLTLSAEYISGTATF